MKSDRSCVYRIPKLEDAIGLKRSSIYSRMNPNSPSYDPTFPRPISLGGSSVGWLVDDVDIWLMSKKDLSK